MERYFLGAWAWKHLPCSLLFFFFWVELCVTTAAVKLCKQNTLISVGNVDEEDGSVFLCSWVSSPANWKRDGCEFASPSCQPCLTPGGEMQQPREGCSSSPSLVHIPCRLQDPEEGWGTIPALANGHTTPLLHCRHSYAQGNGLLRPLEWCFRFTLVGFL